MLMTTPSIIYKCDSSFNDLMPAAQKQLARIGAFGLSEEQRLWQVQDVKWMQLALQQAQIGGDLNEVPVGALLVHEGKILGQGFNQPITQHDPTCHAEIVALRSACELIENYRLPLGTTLYVTLEPCTMCFGALIHARLSRIIYAAREPRAGMLGSQLDLSAFGFYNHNIQVSGGLCAEQSSQLLKAFFKHRRQRNKKPVTHSVLAQSE